jgi:hypothetical protein
MTGRFGWGAEVILGLSNLYLTEKNQSGTTKNYGNRESLKGSVNI